ncbi:hypothetical protein C0993_001600, partial [Termitomyces sp. T159_Od127]
MNNATLPQPAQVPGLPELPDASITHASGMSTFPEHAMYSQRPGIEPNPSRITKTPTSRPQSQSPSSLLGSMPLPTYQMNAASGARLYRDLGGATDMLDDQAVLNNREVGPASLSAELIQQQAQLQMT